MTTWWSLLFLETVVETTPERHFRTCSVLFLSCLQQADRLQEVTWYYQRLKNGSGFIIRGHHCFVLYTLESGWHYLRAKTLLEPLITQFVRQPAHDFDNSSFHVFVLHKLLRISWFWPLKCEHVQVFLLRYGGGLNFFIPFRLVDYWSKEYARWISCCISLQRWSWHQTVKICSTFCKTKN